ncbi:MAG: hypothetical protein EOM26_10235 [Alphaproteobacteria bacterium]|nr:hypothetical protein [Alphaproteobacteria bacterium]
MTWVLVVLALFAGDRGGAYEIHTERFKSEAACKEAARELTTVPAEWNSNPKIKAVCIKDSL